MEKRVLFKKVGLIVTELTEQYQYLSGRPENVNDLELELFLANANFLTDHIEILRKINNAGSTPVTADPNVPEAEAGFVEPVHNTDEDSDETTGVAPDLEAETSAIAQKAPDHALEEETELSPVALEEPQADSMETPSDASPEQEEPAHFLDVQENRTGSDEENSTVGENTAPAEKEAEPIGVDYSNENQDVTASVTEAPRTQPEEIVKEVVIPEKVVSVEVPVKVDEPAAVPTINEMISARVSSATVGTRFGSNPVADLKSIISLNDKLLFVKDLFDGYSLAYSEAIELLNRFDSFEAADNFLQKNYAEKNNWKEKQPAVDKLYVALNRRFAK